MRAIYVCVVVSITALALVVAPAAASAASPVLEFVPSSGSFPTYFEAEGGNVDARLGEFDRIVECSGSEGEGKITGPRTTLSIYWFTGCVAKKIGGGGTDLKCKSAGAEEEEEIESEVIEADLVYLSQANHAAAMLLNPGGGVYMEFECGGNAIKASGPFLSPVGPVNQLAPSFTAVLERNGNTQTVTEYEDLDGVTHQAIPTAEVNSEPPDTSGVALAFTVLPSAPLEIKSVNTLELEAKAHEEAKKHREEEAAAKKRQDDEAAAQAAKKHQEEEAAALAAKRAEAKARAQKLTKALKKCKKVKAKGKRVQCKKRAVKKFGPRN